MLNNFSKNKFNKLQVQGGGGDRNKRGSPPPHLLWLKRMMASQRRHEQTISDLENAIKAKDSKIAEQNDSLSYFSDTTRRLMTENNQSKTNDGITKSAV